MSIKRPAFMAKGEYADAYWYGVEYILLGRACSIINDLRAGFDVIERILPDEEQMGYDTLFFIRLHLANERRLLMQHWDGKGRKI